MTGWNLGDSNDDDDNAHGSGNNYYIIVTRGKLVKQRKEVEVANIQNCSYDYAERNIELSKVRIMPLNRCAYKCYAIHVSKDTQGFPTSWKKLKLEIEECCE